MTYTPPFHTSSYESDPVYHNNSECGDGKRVIRDGHKVDSADGRRLCDECALLNAEGK